MHQIEVVNIGKTFEGLAGETLLDTIRRLGYQLRVSCRNGVCQICEITLLQGEVKQRYPEVHIKLEDNHPGVTLYACTSTPLTDIRVNIGGLKAPESDQ